MLGGVKDLQAARALSVAGLRASKELRASLWLIPIEARRHLDSDREGMLGGFTLGNYLMLVEHIGSFLSACVDWSRVKKRNMF